MLPKKEQPLCSKRWVYACCTLEGSIQPHTVDLSSVHFDSCLSQINCFFYDNKLAIHSAVILSWQLQSKMIYRTDCILSSHHSETYSHHWETLDIETFTRTSKSFPVELKCERIKSVKWKKVVRKGYDSGEVLSFLKSKSKYRRNISRRYISSI